ncbi:MAG: rhomboid family intramembrane serine protease [Planctomycetes bacterium]|nr:rhomboid family intramembrane serine protease [Planctomycetota bacterium]
MPVMEPGHEVDAPATDDQTPLPLRVDSLGDAMSSAPPPAPEAEPDPTPTPGSVLLAVARADGPWFPSKYAAEARVARDLLDEPLAELRLAGLVRVAEWVRGAGQGYALTPEGKAAATDPAALERLKRPAAAGPAVVQTGDALTTKGTDDAAGAAGRADGEELVLNPPIVVPALLMANVLWFFVCAVYSIRWGLTPSRALSEGHHEVLHRFGAVHGADLLNGEWWRLLTCCFVHIGALHLVVNMLALAMMGPLAELLWGRARLLLIYLVSGLAGSALAMALRPDTILAGASGAIWGIQMSLFAWLFAFRRHLPPDLANDWFRRLFVVFVLNAGGSFLPNVSWEGHLGGGAAGFLVAGLLNVARFGDRRRRLGAWLLLTLLPVLCVAGLAGAMDAKGMAGWQRLRQRLSGDQEARESVERRQRVRDAEVAYRTQVLPRLAELAPDAIRKTELEAVELAQRTKRPAERVEDVKKKLRPLRAAAGAVLKYAPAEPVGSEPFDRVCARSRAFAAARTRALDALLAMLDTPTVPAEAWATWQAAHREAESLWLDWPGK